ncbi:MAG TPA: hypothetical protein VMG12_08675 [Polyangiaceae bacterium]|nr:hypothetical protein [Polyangiaceae bacterium]
MRVFSIGDSTVQGFMSLAAARTQQCFSALVQRQLAPRAPYLLPEWPLGGHPLDLEIVLRELDQRFGPDIRGFIEWPRAFVSVTDYMDKVEDYYERGAGAADLPTPGGVQFFHNVAVRGFEVADAWLVTPALCRQFIAKSKPRRDDALAVPSESFHRTALRVLNPSCSPAFDQFSALDWLAHHARAEGVENTLLWLGSNNALGVVLDLVARRTPNDPARRPVSMTHRERVDARYNLWHPDDFHAEYAALLERVSAAHEQNAYADWKVFVGTVPFVTIAPLAKGVGATTLASSSEPNIDGKVYFKYYTYFPFEEEDIDQGAPKLRLHEALQIDEFIARYNRSIRALVEQQNRALGKPRYFIVDIEKILADLAWKRNGGSPLYRLPPYLDDLVPRPNTLFYHGRKDGSLESGGIFSLDGVHATPIGQGLLALEFLKVMQAAGVAGADPGALDWPSIVKSDSLYQKPLRIMSEFRENKDLIQWALQLFRLVAGKG